MDNHKRLNAFTVYIITVVCLTHLNHGRYVFTVRTPNSNRANMPYPKDKYLSYQVDEDRGFTSKQVLALSDGVGGWYYPSGPAANLIVHSFAKTVIDNHDQLDAMNGVVNPDFFYKALYSSFIKYNQKVHLAVNTLIKDNQQYIQQNPEVGKKFEYLTEENYEKAHIDLGGAGTLLGAFLVQANTDTPMLNIYQAGDSLALIMRPHTMPNNKTIFLPHWVTDDMQVEFNAPVQLMTPIYSFIKKNARMLCNKHVDDDVVYQTFQKMSNRQIKKFGYKVKPGDLIILGSDGLFDNLTLPLITLFVNIIVPQAILTSVPMSSIKTSFTVLLNKFAKKLKRQPQRNQVDKKLAQKISKIQPNVKPEDHQNLLEAEWLCSIITQLEEQVDQPRQFINNFMQKDSGRSEIQRSSRESSLESDKGISYQPSEMFSQTGKRPASNYLLDKGSKLEIDNRSSRSKNRLSTFEIEEDVDRAQVVNKSQFKTAAQRSQLHAGGRDVNAIINQNKQRDSRVKSKLNTQTVTKRKDDRRRSHHIQKAQNQQKANTKPIDLGTLLNYKKDKPGAGTYSSTIKNPYLDLKKDIDQVLRMDRPNIGIDKESFKNPYLSYKDAQKSKVQDQLFYIDTQHKEEIDDFLLMEQLAQKQATASMEKKKRAQSQPDVQENSSGSRRRETQGNASMLYKGNRATTESGRRTRDAFKSFNQGNAKVQLKDMRILAALSALEIEALLTCPLEDYLAFPETSNITYLNTVKITDCLKEKLSTLGINKAQIGNIKHDIVSELLADAAYQYSQSPIIDISQFSLKAKQFGHDVKIVKPDDITVIVSSIKKEKQYDAKQETRAAKRILDQVETATYERLLPQLTEFLLNTMPLPEFYVGE